MLEHVLRCANDVQYFFADFSDEESATLNIALFRTDLFLRSERLFSNSKKGSDSDCLKSLRTSCLQVFGVFQVLHTMRLSVLGSLGCSISHFLFLNSDFDQNRLASVHSTIEFLAAETLATIAAELAPCYNTLLVLY